jgi:hypothetical protein
MILDYQTFIYSGLPVASDIASEEVEFAIKNVEHAIVKPRLGVDLYADIVENPSDYTEAVNGSNTVGGLLLAEENLVFAYLLYTKIRLTRYSTVVKDDEHSMEPALKDLLAFSKNYWETGFMLLDEVCEFLQAPEPKYPLNNLIFGELMLTI